MCVKTHWVAQHKPFIAVVAVACSVLQCAAVCVTRDMRQSTLSCSPRTLHRSSCSVLQCVAVCCSMLQWQGMCTKARWLAHHGPFTVAVQCAAVCCSVLQCVAVCFSVLQCGAVYVTRGVCQSTLSCSLRTLHRSVLQRVAVCCSVLQCVAVYVPRDVYQNSLSPTPQTLRLPFLQLLNAPIQSTN